MAVTWKKLAYADDVILKSLITAHGDLIYGTGVGAVTVLAHGSDGDLLSLSSSLPVWVAPGAPVAHTLNSHSAANGAVDFNLNVATDLVVHTVANEAALPVAGGAVAVGMLAFATSELTLHVCTVGS